MLRLSYPIGRRTLADILPYFKKHVDVDKDISVNVISLDSYRNGVIVLSNTPIGDSYITFFCLKHAGNPLVIIERI